ncbi:MAG: hypothetical protein JW996_06000 [Candidatus Cloacimonetes bacterium]|nr:hypothetical protein [Candidatus Cloacimonadota bacterium]
MTKRLVIIGLVLALASLAFAELGFDVAGKLYNQMRWTNGASGFGAHTNIWAGRDNERFGNFVRSEAEFEINATVSKYVKVYMRMKTIFDSDDYGEPNDGSANASAWQTYWTDQTGWFKLRGFRIDFMPPFEYVDVIGLGTPMGLRFSKWFMADRRYIDRDNAKGIYVQGHFSDQMKWNLIRMWQPDWQGYNWGTGSFHAEDATWAFNLNNVLDNFTLDFDGVWYIDVEFDPEDYDNPNYSGEDDEPDGTMSGNWPYMAYGAALSGSYDFTDAMGLDFNVMMTGQSFDTDLADADEDNIVDDWADWWPSPKYASVMTPSGVLSLLTTDPFDNGFSPNLQFFYIHHNYISYWGSRREHDLLMIDGGIDGIRNVYGDRLGLNTFLWGGDQIGVRHEFRDNDFLRLGEGLVESPVGYWGGTFDFDFDLDTVTLMGQVNYLGATDNTGGDVDKEDPNYDGEGDLYMTPRDFSGLVANLGVKTKVSTFDLGLEFRYGMWQDNGIGEMEESREDYTADDHSTNAMVIEPMLAKQLTSAMSMELKPRYQTVKDEYGDGDYESTTSDIVISHKWVYNLGGFDFWLRGEHLFRTSEYTYEEETRSTDEHDYSSHTLQAAWEVKF